MRANDDEDSGTALIENDKFVQLEDDVSSMNYLAPEIITSKRVSYKSDVWAVAVMSYYMRCGHTPFEGTTSFETRQQIFNIEFRWVFV